MRIVLVGRPADRDRLRAELVQAGLEIALEAPTLTAARASNVEADAVVLASARAPTPAGERPVSDVDDGIDIERYAIADEPLTPRELEVLELLAEGLSNKGIAARLGISDQTVKFHVASIAGKLAAANRTDVVRRAVRRGLIVL